MKNGSIILLSCAGLVALLLATPTVAHAADAGIGPSFKGPIGLQLYSLRDQLGRDVPGTLAKVRQFGIRSVELAGTGKLEPAEFKTQLETNGLDAVSAHFPFERFVNDAEGIAAEAKTLGLRYVGCAWIPHRVTSVR